jgi:hypothetical protein
MKIRLAVLGAGLCLAAAAQAHAQAVQLRFLPPVGQVAHYRTVSQLWASGDTTAAPMLSTLYSTRTVTGMDGANFILKTVMDSTVTAMPGGGGPGGRPGMGGDMMRGMTITQHLDPRGRVVSSEVTPPPGLPPFVANMMNRNSGSTSNRNTPMWPEGPVSPGYTWTDTLVQSASAGRGRPTQFSFIVTYKFERVEHQGGTRQAIISANGTAQGGQTGTYSGEVALDLDAGRLAHMTMNMTMQAPESSAPMRMKMTMETLP